MQLEEKKKFQPYLITESEVLKACGKNISDCPEQYQQFVTKMVTWPDDVCDVDPISLEEIPSEYALRFRSVIAPGTTALVCRDVRELKVLLERAKFEKRYMSAEMLARMGLPTDIQFPLVTDPVSGLPYGPAQIEAIENHEYSRSFDLPKFQKELIALSSERKERDDKEDAKHAFEEEQKLLREQFGVHAGGAQFAVYQIPGAQLMAELEAVQSALTQAQDELEQIQALLNAKMRQLQVSGKGAAYYNSMLSDMALLRMQAQDALLRVEMLSASV